MKKFISIVLVAVMAIACGVSAFAATGFVSSPSGNPAPVVVSGSVKVTPYAERSTLTPELKTLIEKAYSEIAASSDLTALIPGLSALANGKQVSVSDLFDISPVQSSNNGYDVVLKADTLKDFVALAHMTKDGKWEVISGAKVSADGKNLEMHLTDCSPFAIVVANNRSPETGSNAIIITLASIMAVSAAAAVSVAVVRKKRSV
ncbi:MAG: hypothetical protein MJ137_07385 [Clostridia bacterium]|nr:hypothetical protein [Clostridia bacterium]